jgi:hypothetical protein
MWWGIQAEQQFRVDKQISACPHQGQAEICLSTLISETLISS